MNPPEVSVTMAVRNVDRFLADSIESILDQTLSDFEFIIVDFGSTDNSKEIVHSYSARDKRIRHFEIPNLQLVEARNAAFERSTGRFIAVMDADDVCLPHRLQREVTFLEEHPKVGIVGAATEWIDAAGAALGIHKVPCEDGEIRRAFVTHCPFWHPTVLARREALEAVGGYRSAFVYAHDYDMELRVAEKFECANLEEVLVRYRVHPQQVTFRKQALQSICKIAARRSALARRLSQPDPLQGVREITPSLLSALGISEREQRIAIVTDCLIWLRSMAKAGEHSAAIDAASEMLKSSSREMLGWQRAALLLLLARVHWERRNFPASVRAFVSALVARPLILGRPFKALLPRAKSREGNK